MANSEVVVGNILRFLDEEKEKLLGEDAPVVELRKVLELLKDAWSRSGPQIEDRVLQNMAAEVRNIVYDAGDVLEIYNHHRESERRGGIPHVLKTKFCIFDQCAVSHNVWRKIHDIQSRTSQVNDRLRATIPKEEEGWSLTQRMLRRSSSDVDKDFVGLDDVVRQLVDHLLEHGTGGRRNVVSICGMRGLGKTSIARKVYNHPQVKDWFEASAWVCMPQEQPSLQDTLQQILIQLIQQETTDLRGVELIRKVFEVQQHKRCLIVLDDIRPTSDLLYWEGLRHVFPVYQKKFAFPNSDDVMGTKLLLTTRNKEMASHLDPDAIIYRPRFLLPVESVQLFQRKAFSGRGCHELEVLGREMIISRVRGLPLAVKMLGELLGRKQTLREWVMVCCNNGYSLERLDGEEDLTVWETLALRYYDLPYRLMSCFHYLGNLPEDSKIETEKLFHLWMAENMVTLKKPEEKETMIDVAEGYLKELEQRCMVEVQVDVSTGRIKSCGIQQFVRALCLSNGNEEDFDQVIDLRPYREDKEIIFSSTSSSPSNGKVRRHAIYLGDLDDLDKYVPPKRGTARYLRSVLFFVQNYNRRSRISRAVESHLSDFKQVRVLDLGGLVFSKLDESIGNLIYLKYLGLRYTVFHALPSTIQNMAFLQTLDLWDDNTQHAGVSIPNVLCKLERLRYLYLRRLALPAKQSGKLQLEGLRELETLENFDSKVFNVNDLFKLTNLRKLGAKINDISDLEKLTTYLSVAVSNHLGYLALSIKYCDLYSEKGRQLVEQVLTCRILDELSLDGRTGKLPVCDDSFSQSLTKLTLESCELTEDPMANLQNLPNLRSLFLKWNAYVGDKMVCSANGFPELRILQIWQMQNLEKWKVDKGAMPKLSSLDIISCPKLKMIPYGFKFVTTLQELVISGMPETFNKLRVRDGKGGEDIYKVPKDSIKMIDYDGTQAGEGDIRRPQ